MAVAVSGGGDSMALLDLAATWAKETQTALWVLTVDHKLRAEAADEIALVAARCGALGLGFQVLDWSDWDHQGNLMDQARRARYRLMADWAHRAGIADILLAHTRDDQAETLLMRLGRGAGVDGLAAMRPRRNLFGVTWHRPLLGFGRSDLRDHLRARSLKWAEDPSNDDPAFSRIQMRHLQETLSAVGITPQALGQVAENMAMAADALEAQADAAAQEALSCQFDALVLDRDKLRAWPSETQRRVVLRCLKWFRQADYAPRQSKLETFVEAVLGGTPATLEGCQVCDHKGRSWIFKEWRVVQHVESKADTLWDGRWRLRKCPADQAEVTVRPLGQEGATALAEHWRGVAPRAAILATPAIFCANDFIAAPLLAATPDWEMAAKNRKESLYQRAVTH